MQEEATQTTILSPEPLPIPTIDAHDTISCLDSEIERRHYPYSRYRRLSFADRMVMGILCCFCWPFGAGARVFLILVPTSKNSCLTEVARRQSTTALVLGILLYVLLFLLFSAVILILYINLKDACVAMVASLFA